jgi:hypothetical protein
MPGVSVTITHLATGQAVKLVINESGNYSASLLQVGAYKIEAEQPIG